MLSRFSFVNKNLLINIAFAIFTAIITVCFIAKISDSRATQRANAEQIAQLNAEDASIKDEIEYYEYKKTQPKDEFVEEEARNSNYVYENETKFYNCTPGSDIG